MLADYAALIARENVYILTSELGVCGVLVLERELGYLLIENIAVAPAVQDQGVGRALMEAALERERERQAPGVRLVQTAYHYRSLALYAKLGFVVREPLSVLQGRPPAISTILPARSFSS